MPTRGAVTRASLACVPCRSRHIKCDGGQPECTRCAEEGRVCQYMKSRRGGLDRQALALRRTHNSESTGSKPQTPNQGSHGGHDSVTQHETAGQESLQPDTGLLFETVHHWAPIPETSDHEPSQHNPVDESDAQFVSISEDPLIDMYYKHFHKCHPCVLPRRDLEKLHGQTGYQEKLATLIPVMRFIGSLYSRPDLFTKLRDLAAEAMDTASRNPATPFMVQSRLLYAIVLYWACEKTKSRGEIDEAIRMALELGMHHRHFAAENADGDVLLGESWRRTWWQVYIVDAYFAAMTPKWAETKCNAVEASAGLPCEEDEYEIGAIPTPKTLEDFGSREFEMENTAYSSFAYLIAAARGVALAMSAVPSETSKWSSPKVIGEVDSIIDGWLLLLPKDKSEVLGKNGEVDELMFQAHMALYASTAALHRPFSELWFNPLEAISTCTAPPPSRLPTQDYPAIHTRRCLKAVQAQVRLLALPVPHSCRTPFTICMTSAGMTPLLSAAKFLFSGQKLSIARHQIRLVIGCLKALAEVWPQGGTNLWEVQTIAREVLGRAGGNQGQEPSAQKAGPNVYTISDSTLGNAAFDDWDNLSIPLEPANDVEAYWNLNNGLQQDMSMWFT